MAEKPTAPRFDVTMHGPGPYSKSDVMLVVGDVVARASDYYYKRGFEAGAAYILGPGTTSTQAGGAQAMTDFEPMRQGQADELFEAILDVAYQQPPDIRDRIVVAIKSGLYDVVRATPDSLTIEVRGIGELMVRRVPQAVADLLPRDSDVMN